MPGAVEREPTAGISGKLTRMTESQSDWTSRFWQAMPAVTSLIAVGVSLCAAIMVYRATEHGIQQQYIGLATSILKGPPKGQPDVALRAWALVILQNYSPVPLPPDVVAGLKAGTITLPNLAALSAADDAALADLQSTINEARA